MKIKRTVILAGIPKTEHWLSELALQGYVLEEIKENTFVFSESEPQKLHYILIDPEKSAQNGSWIYYEAQQNGAVEINHTSTLHALRISAKTYEQNDLLWEYYYAHRNYFLLHRLVGCLVFSVIIGLLALFCCFIGISMGAFDFVFACLGVCCVIPCAFYTYSLRHFLMTCKENGRKVHWKRPIRPGYEKS